MCVLAVAVALGAAACGPKLAPVPAPPVTRYPDLIFPAVPPPLARDAMAASRHERGWAFLQAGDLRGAQREFAAGLARNAAFYPAETGLALVALLQKDYRGALARLDRVLQRAPQYAPALMARGDALLGTGRTADALAAFEAVLAVEPSMPVARQRMQVLQLRVVQEQLANARKAADAGRFDEARRAYERAIAASPESAFLHRDLGAVARRQGDAAVALASFRRAVALDPSDARSWIQIGELLEEGGEVEGALDAYARAETLEPGDAVKGRIDRLRARAALARLPAEYAAIPATERLTRGELAALIGVGFPALLEAAGGRQQALVTDVRGHWAAAWIIAVTRAGVIEPFPNHTFRPRAVVSRVDMARAAARLIDLATLSRPALAARWAGKGPAIADMSASHLAYPAVNRAVAAGILPLFEDNTFRASHVMSGQEATQALARLERLLGAAPPAGRTGAPRR